MTEATNSNSKRRQIRKGAQSQACGAPLSGNVGAPAAAPVRESKISKVVSLLEREEGATLDEMAATTGWQRHTTRAALTGLRKKGNAIEREKRGETSCYRLKVVV